MVRVITMTRACQPSLEKPRWIATRMTRLVDVFRQTPGSTISPEIPMRCRGFFPAMTTSDLNFLILTSARDGNDAVLKNCLQNPPANLAASSLAEAAVVAILGDHVESLRLLLDAGVSSQHQDERGCSLIRLAATKDALACLNLLHERGAPLHAPGEQSPLHSACHTNAVRVVRFLLEHGVPHDCVNREGEQPAHIAARQWSQDCVEALIEANANLHAENHRKVTPARLLADYVKKTPSAASWFAKISGRPTNDAHDPQAVANRLRSLIGDRAHEAKKKRDAEAEKQAWSDKQKAESEAKAKAAADLLHLSHAIEREYLEGDYASLLNYIRGAGAHGANGSHSASPVHRSLTKNLSRWYPLNPHKVEILSWLLRGEELLYWTNDYTTRIELLRHLTLWINDYGNLAVWLENIHITDTPLPPAAGLFSGGWRNIGINSRRLNNPPAEYLALHYTEWALLTPGAEIIRNALTHWSRWVLVHGHRERLPVPAYEIAKKLPFDKSV